MNDKIIDALFETEAIRMAPADHPFWYTSGMLGPFYCNTHFLLNPPQYQKLAFSHRGHVTCNIN